MVLAGNLLAGRYQLDEPIGTGWFGEVWRATDAALSRPVAVKLLHSAYAQQPEALARFRIEAMHAAALWHENITHIYDYDEPAEGPQPYLVMELVDGPSLAGVLAGGPLDAARTMDVIAQAAAGLQAAHTMGLVHGDIRPGNLLLASSGTVKITDWGDSHAIGSVPITVTGTAEYLAPERTAGAQAGPASDLYALGVVAYECLAGAPPFVGEPPDVARAHGDHPVPPLPGSVPADVSALVMRLVAKDPAGRPGSAAEVAQQAGRLRPDPRDDFSIDASRTPYPLANAAAVRPPPPAMAPAPVADGARWQVPAATRSASRARTDARRLRSRPVLVLVSVAIAGLIGMVLAVTVGVTSVQHLADALPSARPGHSTSGAAAGPPVRPPSSARPSRSSRPATSPGDASTVPVAVSRHRTITGSVSGRERIRRHRDGSDTGQGHGNGNRRSHGNGHGEGNGNGHGNGHGQGHGNGNGHTNGNGNGHANGNGNGPRRAERPGRDAQVLSISN